MRKTITALLATLLLSAALAATNSGIQVSSAQVNMIPGEKGYLTLSLTNVGTTPAYETKIAFIGLDSNLTSTLCNACVLYSSTRKSCLEYNDACYINLGDIYSSNVKTITYPITIPETTADGYYMASFQLRINNDTYIDYSVLINVSRVKTDFELIVQNLEVDSNGEGSIDLKVANVGLTEAKGVSMTLNKIGVLVSNIDSVYVGDLTPGEYAKVSFDFNLGQVFNRTLSNESLNLTGVKDLVFTINYTNVIGDRLSDNITKEIDFGLVSVTTRFNGFSAVTTGAITGLDFNTVISYAFIAGVVVVVVFFFLKSRRKKK